MLLNDSATSLREQMKKLNLQFHATIANGGSFEEVKSLYQQMKGLYQKASAMGIDIAPESTKQTLLAGANRHTGTGL